MSPKGLTVRDNALDDSEFSQDPFVAQIDSFDVNSECTSMNGDFDENIQKRQASRTCPAANDFDNNNPGVQKDYASGEKSRNDAAIEKERCRDGTHKFLRHCGGPIVGIYPGNRVLNCNPGELFRFTLFINLI